LVLVAREENIWELSAYLKYNINVDTKEIVCAHMDWIQMAQGRDQWRALVNPVMNLRVP
jgi:hypothetical protein